MKITSKALVGILIAGAALISGRTAQAASIVVDNFNAGPQSVQVKNGGNTASSQVGPFATTNIIGGYRDMVLSSVTGTSTSRSASALVSATNPFVNFSNGTGVVSTLSITWDGNDSPSSVKTDGLGGIDLTKAGELEGLSVLFKTTDQNITLTMNVWDMSGNQSQATIQTTQAINTNQSFNFVYNPSDFNVIPSNPATVLFQPVVSGQPTNFTNVGAIQLVLTGNPTNLTGLDATFDNVASVDLVAEIPEPSSIVGLLVVMVLGTLSKNNLGNKR